MNLTEKYIKLVEVVNNSVTNEKHRENKDYLNAWTTGARDAGGYINLCAADNFYLDQGIDRPMCCGVWLDWQPGIKKTI